MEMKDYQKDVINDLRRFLELLVELKDMSAAYKAFWNGKNVRVGGEDGLPSWQSVIPGVPNVCFKVPTGGGKTFLACNAIRTIFNFTPNKTNRAVVWLVPSDAILDQTLRNLKNPGHPYRQKINADFGGRVAVYAKDELLAGQNFSPATVSEQLSIMVLSYDSFRRGRGIEAMKAYRENSALSPFVANSPIDNPIPNADETSLFQVINQLNPVVIVDESHHATTPLSREMLQNFNPCFVLDLTATPGKESNIISFVDAVRLKKANMVKLPVYVFNRKSVANVFLNAISLRDSLEKDACEMKRQGGPYVRPIVLFQAQSKGREEAVTFENVKTELITKYGIPSEQIAIKTATINELKQWKDLLSEECPIRYIITVNALKEGWDCPFAYILASLANRTSPVEVEQVLGRVLRQPYSTNLPMPSLNLSYVLTSSDDFSNTLLNIVAGLNNAGFSKQDYRASEENQDFANTPPVTASPISLPLTPATGDIYQVGNSGEISSGMSLAEKTKPYGASGDDEAEALKDQAIRAGQQYEEEISSQDSLAKDIPAAEVSDTMSRITMNKAFVENVLQLKIPQFHISITNMLGETYKKLAKEDLYSGFLLKGRSYDIDFKSLEDEIYKIDIQERNGGLPRAFKVTPEEYQLQKLHSDIPLPTIIEEYKRIIYNNLNKSNTIVAKDLKEYINLVFQFITPEQIANLDKTILLLIDAIKKKIAIFQKEHAKKQFDILLKTGNIVTQPAYQLPYEIHPLQHNALFANSLYEEEENVNGLEENLARELSAENSNVLWWHRNIKNHGFCINSFIDHYPDFMIMTKSGKLVLAETKGGHLKNEQTEDRIFIGDKWARLAGSDYRYFMIFENNPMEGTESMSSFLQILQHL